MDAAGLVTGSPSTWRHQGSVKAGPGLDLPIAVGILVALGVIPAESVGGFAFFGELGLDGSVRGVPGVAPMVAAAAGLTTVVAPASAREARAAASGTVRTVSRLSDVIAALTAEAPWPDPLPDDDVADSAPLADLADVRGQPLARRALEVAAAGGHHLLLVGAPGAGKTMLANRLPSLLPALERDVALQTTMVHSAAGVALPAGGVVHQPPFRAPHHTCSIVALVGGGTSSLRPGEISCSHGGVLFLDELGEFAPTVLEGLRQPLEEGVIRVARARANATLPARFLLVAATNPCPCGGGRPGACECDERLRHRYLRRLSGPLLDRFDLRVPVNRPDVDDLIMPNSGEEPSAIVAQRVAVARRWAIERAGRLNAALDDGELERAAPLSHDARALLRHELQRDRLTGRGYQRIRRVARTIADLDPRLRDEAVGEEQVALALQLRVRLSAGHRERVA